MIFAIELKKCVVGARVLGVIIGKLCYKKKPCPIILLEVNKGLEVDFFCTILPFSQSVYLGVKNNEEFLLDA